MFAKKSFFTQALAFAGAFCLTFSLIGQPGTQKGTRVESRAGESGYVLSPNDVIQLKVFQEDDLDTRARVNRDGTVTLPLVGVVNIGGRSVEEATTSIRELLAADFLVNPQVTLTVVEFAKRRFTVLGHVHKPGAFEIPEGETITLLQAIAMAGGYTRIAAPWKVNVQRNIGGDQKIFKIDAQQMAKEKDGKVFEIQPNDIISVDEKLL